MGSVRGSEVEIKDSCCTARLVVGNAVLLDKLRVEDGARGWVREAAPFVFEEESLGDPLVHDDHGDLGDGRNVVELLDGFTQLGNLAGEDLLAHGITNTVTVHDEVGWLLSVVAFLEAGDGLPDQILHLVIDDFCSLGHEKVVRVVLGHCLVRAGSEADYGVAARMADIDADKHGVDLVHDGRELHLEEISTHLRVHLPQDVGSLRGVKRPGIPVRDDLRSHPELIKDQLVLPIQRLFKKNHHHHHRMSERTSPKHVLVQVVLQVLQALLPVQLDPLRLFNLHVELLAGHLEGFENLVRRIVLSTAIHNDPLFFLQVDRVLDRQPAQGLLVAVDNLILAPDFWGAENVSLQLDRF